MNPQDHYRTMTDEQLAHCTRLQQCVDRLTRDLDTSRKATEAVQAHALAREGQMRGRLALLEAEILKMAVQRGENQMAVRRLCGQQVRIVRALRALVDVILSNEVLAHQREWPSDVYRTIEQAEEVLKLVEVPFG